MNKVHLIGNLGADAKLNYTSKGEPNCYFSLATNKTWKTESGEKKQSTEWHKCYLWGKRAESLTQYLTKGLALYVEGEIHYREYTDKEGVKRYTTDINVKEVEFLPGGKGESHGSYPPAPDDNDVPVHTGKPQAAKPATNDDAAFMNQLKQTFDGQVVPSEEIPF